MSGIIPHFEKCYQRGASLCMKEICERWYVLQQKGGVGIVCHRMNLWDEAIEECRAREGTVLIGFSLRLSPLPPTRGEGKRLLALRR